MDIKELERVAYIAASSTLLCELLPEDWMDMEDHDLDQFVIGNVWEPFEYLGSNDLWHIIADSAAVIINFYKTHSEKE